VDGWKQPLGPIQDYVLSDIFNWLNDPSRKVHYFFTQQQSKERTINEMQIQLSSFNSELESAENIIENLHSDSVSFRKEIDKLNDQYLQRQESWILSGNLTYIALGLSLFSAVKSMCQNTGRDSIEE
jgi:hypothetical protein